MRYFVLCVSLEPGIDPYIAAEVVHAENEERAFSMAAAIAGSGSEILSRDELGSTTVGRRALDRWEHLDDSSFDSETEALARVSRRDGRFQLTLVVPAKDDPADD